MKVNGEEDLNITMFTTYKNNNRMCQDSETSKIKGSYTGETTRQIQIRYVDRKKFRSSSE